MCARRSRLRVVIVGAVTAASAVVAVHPALAGDGGSGACITFDAGVTKSGGGTVVSTPWAPGSCVVPTPGWGVVAQPSAGDEEDLPPGTPNGYYVNATVTLP